MEDDGRKYNWSLPCCDRLFRLLSPRGVRTTADLIIIDFNLISGVDPQETLSRWGGKQIFNASQNFTSFFPIH